MISTEYQEESVLGTKREDNQYPVGDPRRDGGPVFQITGTRPYMGLSPIAGDPQPLPPGGKAIDTVSTPHIPPGPMVIGTCSKCRGPVVMPSVWFGIYSPVPTCRQCGARKEQPYGPVIEME